MKYDEKKTIEVNPEEDPNILEILGDEKKNLEENKKLKIEIELVRFGNITRTIFELTDDEKFEHAKNLKSQFVDLYKQKEFGKGINMLKEAIGVIDKINKEHTTEEITKFKNSLLLNECNCYNNMKEYNLCIKTGKEVVALDPKLIKAYYYMGNAYAYLDEFKDATDCYNKLYELIPDKNDPGVVALNELINKRRKTKEDAARRKYKAYFAQKSEDK